MSMLQFGKLDLADSSVCEPEHFPLCTNHNCGGTRPSNNLIPSFDLLSSRIPNSFQASVAKSHPAPWPTPFYFILNLDYDSYPFRINISHFVLCIYLQCTVSLRVNKVSVSSIRVPSPQALRSSFFLTHCSPSLTLTLSDLSFELAPAPCRRRPRHRVNTPPILPIPPPRVRVCGG